MHSIALNGPMYAGKTTLAQALEKEGYMLINFTDGLKELLAIALNAVGHTTVTLEDIKRDKARYRKLLQEFSEAIGYNRDPYYIERALRPWWLADCPPAVFDNVRFDAQMYHLDKYGFELVRLNISAAAQYYRAKFLNTSLTLAQFQQSISHTSERPLSSEWGGKELEVLSYTKVGDLVKEILEDEAVPAV